MLTFVPYKNNGQMGMDNTDITAAMLADKLKVRPDTMARNVRRKLGTGYGLHTPLDPEQVSALTGKKKTGTIRRPAGNTMAAQGTTARPNEVAPPVAEKTPENPPFNLLRFLQQVKDSLPALRRFAFDTVCILIVVGHAALIWYDCAEMWETPGVIGGGLAFLFVLGAILIATDKTRNRTSGYALGFMFVVDMAAFFVHFPTFLRYASIGEIQTGALCGFICLLSFAALYLYQDSKLD